MGFSSKQKAFCVENYSLLRSPKQVQLLFCKKYGLDSRSRSGIPTAKSIRRWYEQFNVSDCLSVGHKRRGMSYAKPVRCGENIEAVLMSVEATPKKSVRRRSAELGVSQSSVHRILRHDLKMKPYHISVHQGLTPENALQRRTMCALFLRQVREEEDFLRSVWFSDEAHFYLSGTVNSRNYVHWASERPDEVIERNLHVTKATAWVALRAQGVIGPFWFCNEDGATETVTADRYMNVLTRFWRALGRFCGHEARGQQWFMQDGAAPHTARRILTWLTDHFEGRAISRFTEKTWASHSPDLNPLDFFLWGHLKDQMSGEQFQTLNDLKSLVERLIRAVTPEQCEDTIQHFLLRMRRCVQRDGGHIEQLL